MDILSDATKCGCCLLMTPVIVPLLALVYGGEKANLYVKRVWCRRWIKEPIYNDMCLIGYKKNGCYVFFMEREFNTHWKIAECVKEFWTPGDCFIFVCVHDIYKVTRWDYAPIMHDWIMLVGYDHFELVADQPARLSDGTYCKLGRKFHITVAT